MYLLGDIGGTKTRLIFCKSDEDFRKQKLQIFITPQNYREFLELLKSILHSYKSASITHLSACIFGFAGMLDKKKEKLIYAPNLRNFENKNLKRDLEKILKTEVILENDAALAGLGEGKYGVARLSGGQGKNFDVFGYITLSTGIGGVKIIKVKISRLNEDRINHLNEDRINSVNIRVNNSVFNSGNNNSVNIRVDFNTFGFEPGHSFLLTDNFLFEVEELLGGENIRKTFGKKPEDIKDKKFWNFYHQILSIFLINVSIFWSIDKIILGGSVIKSLDFKKLNLLVNKLHPLPIKIKIIKSKLGEMSVLYGGLAIVKQNL
ncbi:MAG: hypothetical protein KatS3mg097_519 [Candidatus Parcubacteria bacterium]|nr:MAG: hypothetical protein KatS3mg097_519 [Candidatus Parcubacteria bacterium]